MTNEKIKAHKTQNQKGAFLNLTKRNYILFGIAVLVLIIGYIALAQGPADSTMSLTVAPILLVIAYCILVPLAIFLRPRKQQAKQN